MFKLIVENASGQKLELTRQRNIHVIGVDGLNPTDANIITSTMAGSDGSRFNSAVANQKNIVIHLRLTGDVETNRLTLYKYFRIKQYCKIYYQNDHRDVYCEGYVESFENDRFVVNNQADISIICPSSWFHQINTEKFQMSQVLPMFEFPFSIPKEGIEFSVLDRTQRTTVINSGEVDTGILIELAASSDVSNPRLYNADTNEVMKINIEMQAGDLIQVSTVKGNKYVRMVRAGVTTNIINRLDKYPVWFQLPPGETDFTYECDSGTEFLTVTFTVQNLFEGV